MIFPVAEATTRLRPDDSEPTVEHCERTEEKRKVGAVDKALRNPWEDLRDLVVPTAAEVRKARGCR
ncbi:hypothetical protein GCM10009801_70210 [Streptomyces albiaxialis]|uniref:Uncharacterized protein n=1 Tax=Streptomyces albiaxialis TaxID=329523 RepID=A0ABN2WV99_9ACTN